MTVVNEDNNLSSKQGKKLADLQLLHETLCMNKTVLGSPFEKYIRMMFSRVIERLAVVVSEAELSFSQVAALHIMDQEDSITIQEMSERLNLSLSATSRLVDDLVTKNFLDRVEDSTNRRSKILTLTTVGKGFLNQLSIERVKLVRSTAESLPQAISKRFLDAVTPKKKE